jgi:tetratricopeptide (TPR) repeat protein
MALALGVLPGTNRPSAAGQEARPPTASDPDAKAEKRIEELDGAIRQQIEAGRIAEAVPPAREKLELLVRLRGTDHWQTGDARRDAETYERIAALPRAVQDRFAEARRGNTRAEQLFGQGQYAQVSELFQQILATDREVLGEEHPLTATGYHNLGAALWVQGKPAEAEPMQRRALAIYLQALGEAHPSTATSYNNLAEALSAQGKSAEAEAMHRRALAIRLQAQGEAHPDTATGYSNLGVVLKDLGKPAEAEAMHRRALAIRLKALGEAHPDTATSYNNLATVLRDQGKYHDAEAMLRRALAVFLKALGEVHPRAAHSYSALAYALELHGQRDEALRTWRLAVASHEQARLLGPKGLEAGFGEGSPLPGLAAALARAGQSGEAWASWERGLARGLVDELTRRAARPLNDEEHDREAALLGRGQAVDERINRLLGARALTQDQEKALEDLRQQASDIRRELLELERQFEDKYGALASRPAALEDARKALPEGTALVGWVDTPTGHWACLLGPAGDPAWVRLAGSGKEGAWTKEEEDLSRSLRSELNPETTKGKASPLAEAVARQRLEPLKGHLAGVRRLIVVNSPGLAGVPVEVLIAARPDPAWDGITVSYAPSASMFAYLIGRPVPRDRPATLLAVADPAYPEPKGDAPAPEPPGSGLTVVRVVANGNADLNGLRAGDILLSYGGSELKQVGDLKPVASDGGPKAVAVRYWREGIAREIEVAAGPLDLDIDPRPAAEFVRARRESERVLLGMRGGARARLPGTRREVEAVAGLFADGGAATILGPQACESTVQGLARSGQLKGYHYLHFATHGESDPRFAYRTALILAPDPDAGADPLALDTDGTITAEQMARTWELDADLVVLSACESGLGLAAGAEGYLGFAQPLFARGAHSLVLSQWKVDDKATALLMTRFYRNLLGRRAGLAGPMAKAEALDEAKRWLRGLTAEEVGGALAALDRGPVRPLAKVDGPAPVVPSSPPGPTGVRPYAHPYYWAAFILIGDPR